MSAFKDLVITKHDYQRSPENPEYFILDQTLLVSLRAGFEQSVKEIFPESEWYLSEGEIPWDRGTMGVKVTPVVKGNPSRRSYILEYGVIPTISRAALEKRVKDDAPVRARILIYDGEEYAGTVCDHEWSGKGWYDPVKWAQEAHQVMTGYVLYGEIPGGH